MFRRDEVTNRVRVVEIIPGEPLQITVAQHVTRPDGKARTITQKTPIFDPCLVQRVLAEIDTGHEITATFVTEWSKEGYKTYMSDFCLAEDSRVPMSKTQDISVPAR